ncbi:acyltransferase [Sphingobium sp. SCG-1]|uniref:acyltransferase family protein n=1 Tax=Sphingobium sp. SCG-1 TaxID=2072936 RepID=UPI000CD676E0|nr:acyltransferase [Sphingobium sp. SCG-1]AUW57341.1 acyltransferase [Sphingobium sp. SCG-1]
MSTEAHPRERPPSTRLRELDALRGLAALSVVIYHYTARFPEMFPEAPHVGFAFTWGHESVLLFFAISGFVISFSLDRAESVADFAVKRFARLYPAYWAAMALTLLVEHLAGATMFEVPSVAIAANVTMLQGFAYLPGVDGAYWTLGLELAFYICMVAVWISGAAGRIEQVLLVWLCLGCIGWAWDGMPSRVTMLLVLQYIPFFGIGMLSYRVWLGVRCWRDQLPCASAIIASLCVQARLELAILALLLFVVFAAMVAGRLRFLAARPLLWLGSISYTLYLVHHNIGFIILLHADEMGLSPLMAVLIAIGVAVALAVLLHHWIEQPLAHAITDWWRKTRQPVGPTSSYELS